MIPGKLLLRCFAAACAVVLGVPASAATSAAPTATSVTFAANTPQVLVARPDVVREYYLKYYTPNYTFTADGVVGYRFEGEDAAMFTLDEDELNAGTRRVSLGAKSENTEDRFRFAWLCITGANDVVLKKIRVAMAPAPVKDEIEGFRFARMNSSFSYNYDEYGNNGVGDAAGIAASSYAYRYISLSDDSEALKAATPDVRWISLTPYSRYARYSFSANDGPARTGSIVFESVNHNKITFSVAQAGTQNGIDYDPRSRVPQSGGEIKLAVRADWDLTSGDWPSKQSWTISSKATWLRFTSATSGTGDATLTLSADANTGKDRKAIVSAIIGGIEYQATVTQVGLATKLEFSADSGLRSGGVLRFGPQRWVGHEFIKAIESDGEISYVFESGEEYFRLDDDAFEQSQTLKISVRSENDAADGSFRFGVLAIRAGDKALRLRLVQCHNGNIERTTSFGLYSYLNYHAFLGANASNSQYVSTYYGSSVFPSTETLLEAEPQVPWISVDSKRDYAFYCSVDKNIGATRVGTVKLTSVVGNVCYYNVTQLGGNGIDAGSIDKIAATGERIYLTVRGDWNAALKDAAGFPIWPSGDAWTLSADESWVMKHVAEDDLSGSGDKRIRVQIDPNPYCVKRDSEVRAKIGGADYTMTLTQAASEKHAEFKKEGDGDPVVECEWSDVDKAGAERLFPLDTTFPRFVYACRDADDSTKTVAWVTPSYDRETKTLKLSAAKNPYVKPRRAVVYIGDPDSFNFPSSPSAEKLLKITVEQALGDPEVVVNKGKAMEYSRSAATKRVVVKGNTDWTVEVAEGGEWLSLGSTVSGRADVSGTISLTLKENLSTSARAGTLRFFYADPEDSSVTLETFVPVRQLADDPFVRIEEGAAQNFGYKPVSGTLTLNSNVSWSLGNATLPDWITLSPTSAGEGRTTVSFSLSENTDTVNRRSVTLMFGNEDLSTKFTISQNPTETISSPSSVVLFPAEGGSRKLKIHSNGSWSAKDWPKWLSISPTFDNAPKDGSAEIALTVATANETGTLRAGNLILTCGESRLTVRVEQQRFYAEPEAEKRGVPEFGGFDYAEEYEYADDLAAEGEERCLNLGFAPSDSGIAFSLNPEWLACELAGTPVKLWIQAIPNAEGARETWIFVLTDSGDLHAVPVRQRGPEEE